MRNFAKVIFSSLLLVAPGLTQGNELLSAYADEPSGDRWMYSFNGTPGKRTTASTFSNLPEDGGVDDRLGQFLIKFDTVAAGVPAGLGASNYHIQKIVLTARIHVPADTPGVEYDPTEDARQTYGPGATPDLDVGRPLELHGAGFRGGFTQFSFLESSPYGGYAPGLRNSYALGFSPEGVARDVSSSVTNGIDAFPWSIGKAFVELEEGGDWEELAPGDRIPKYAFVTFELDLSLPGVSNYVREGFHNGFVWFMLTSLHSVAQEASSGFPAYFTKDHEEHILFKDVAPTLEIEYSLPLMIRSFTHQSTSGESYIEWNGSPGFQYKVQASPDLTTGSWSDLTPQPMTTLTPAPLWFRPSGSGDKHFYRVVRTQQP